MSGSLNPSQLISAHHAGGLAVISLRVAHHVIASDSKELDRIARAIGIISAKCASLMN